MNAYVYWVCGFKMSENQQKVSKSGNTVSRKASGVHFYLTFLSSILEKNLLY